MKRLIIAALAIAGGGLWVGELSAHGGTYRGPGDTVPPGGGGGGGGGPAGGGPGGGPGGGGPTTGGAGTPGAGPGAPTGGGSSGPTTGGGGPSIDLDYWSFWWEFNKEPFLNLRAAIDAGGVTTNSGDFFLGQGTQEQAKDGLRPDEAMIRNLIVPALLEALDSETNPDIVTGSLIALAKIGEATGESGENSLEQRITGFLADSSQEISESAALALGILASDASIEMLEALVRDTADGQKAVGSTEVDPRTRSFAAFGLGLLGARTSDEDMRRRINSIIAELLPAADRMARIDLAVALVISMGLTPLEPAPAKAEGDATAYDPTTSRQGQIDFLLEYLANDQNNFFSRAHVPTAVARLIKGMDESSGYREKVTEVLLKYLEPRSQERTEPDEIKWSAVLAMGLLGDADADPLDVQVRKSLLENVPDSQQRMGRFFARIAMAKIAANPGNGTKAEDGRKELIEALTKSLLKDRNGADQWSAIALGVYGWLMNDKGDPPSSAIGGALLSELGKAKSSQNIAALAIGNGLFGDPGAREQLLEKLDTVREPIDRGYVALGLGLLDDRTAIEPITRVLEEATYQPDLLKQAAIALGLLGDKETVDTLIDMLENAKSLAAQASLASALGFIGDRRSVQPLIDMLGDQSRTETSRGFAAVALGIVADKEDLPWNTKIAVDLNYRASTQTLNAQDGRGVLNIL